MFRPGGYSSEEDLDDEFDTSDYFTNKKVRTLPKVLSDEEKLQNRLDNFYNRITYGEVEAVLKCLQDGMDVNTVFRDGWTPLLLAASYGNDNLAIELIKCGADVNFTRELETPLMAACRVPEMTSSFENTIKIIECLVRNKADVGLKNRKRMTALMYAASTGNTLAIEFLLQFCDKDEVDNQGWSALFWAINDNHYESVVILLQAGLDCTRMDVRRMTPLDYAKQGGNGRIIALLPDPDRKKSQIVNIESHYYFYEEIKRLKFERDVLVMLNAVKCLHLHKIFAHAGVDLYGFLTLTSEKLSKMGVEMPLMQNRILGGIHRFHKHSFHKKSVPVISRNAVYTTTDVANAVFAAMRQLMSMRGSLKYLELNLNFTECSEKGTLLKEVLKIENRLRGMERIAGILKRRTKHWDLDNTPVDLIKPNNRNFSLVTKVISVCTLATIFVYYKIAL